MTTNSESYRALALQVTYHAKHHQSASSTSCSESLVKARQTFATVY
ncbi:hypothetical protein LC607_29245 [Nostoc sp. CHAB 5824]|nr:hypothetical protein [Nostoc sp. CHAB 5824]